MDLVLNNLQWLMCHKAKPSKNDLVRHEMTRKDLIRRKTNQPTNQPIKIFKNYRKNVNVNVQ